MFAERYEKKSKQFGFTLIELAIIIAALGAVGAVKFAGMKDEAKVAAEASALANVCSGLAIAFAKDNSVELGDLDAYIDSALTVTTKVAT